MIRPNATAPMTQQDTIPAVAYYRMSHDSQETSIRDQRTAVERFAIGHNYELISEYVDEAISGDATERRFQFQKMISDAASRRFKAILVWDLSRLGRFDIIEGGFWMKPLRDAGVSIVALDQGEIDWSDIAGRIVWTVQQEGKHQYLRDHARNTLRGKLEAAKRGIWMTRAPYGYRVRKRKLIPGDPAKVKTIRRIFREFLKGTPLHVMCRRLNLEGIKSSAGGTWSPSAIRCMLVNRAYIGETTWNFRHGGKYCRVIGEEVKPVSIRTSHPVKGPESDVIVCKHTHKALISSHAFDAVQVILQRKSSIPNGGLARGRYPLVGMVRCGKCGSSMCGRRNTRRGGHTYRCKINYLGDRDFCGCSAVKEGEILEIIMTAVERHFLHATNVEFRRPKRKTRSAANRMLNLARLQSELTTIENKLALAAQRLLEVHRDLLGVAQEQYRLLQSQRCTLLAALKQIPDGDASSRVRPTVERAVNWLTRLRSSLGIANSVAIHNLLREFVRFVEVWTVRVKVGKKNNQYRLVRAVIHLQGDEPHTVLNYPFGRDITPPAPVANGSGRRGTKQVRVREIGSAANKWK